MGCFSFICPKCGKPINSTSFSGEMARLSLLENGKVIEEMQGQYDSYGRVFGDKGGSFKWESKDWGDIVDSMYDGNPRNGIAAVHVACIDENYKPEIQSEGDPDQGWGKVKTKHLLKGEVYHKVM